MKNVYVVNKQDPTNYIMDAYPATKNVDEYLKDNDYLVLYTTDGALYFLDLWADRFDAQARAEYGAFLVKEKEAEQAAVRPQFETEQAASEALEGALCLAAQSIARALSDELAGAIETREDIDRICERIESYRLALSALARTLDKAELGEEEG